MIRAGFRYVSKRPDLLLILAIVFSAGTFGLNFQMTSALMATEVYGKGASEYGALGSILAIGSLSGALLAARRATTPLRLVVAAAVVFGVVEVAAGLMPTYVAFALVAPLLGLSALTLITAANAYMQLNTTAGMRGRVMALYLMIFMGGTPLGAPLVGWVGEAFGARWTLVGGGLMTLAGVGLASAVYLWDRSQPADRPSPVVRRFDPLAAARVRSVVVSGTSRPMRVPAAPPDQPRRPGGSPRT
jgi:MFS family permease